ncbi:MAG: polysaccharide pyruvyl transferase family protein [Pseudomonadota bacterium]
MYLILHAFSRRNSGDGLLVDLTIEALADAGIPTESCEILALDPDSFDEALPVHRAPGEPFGRVSWRLLRAGAELLLDGLSGGRAGRVGRLAKRARGMIAVGGGYLVADSRVRQAGVLFNHMVQMSAAARADVPTIYLPQSIGPLRGPVGAMARRRLASVDRLYVRDDLTYSELSGANTVRIADLAVLKLARRIGHIAPVAPTGRPVIVARDLPQPGGYLHALERLAAGLEAPIWAVQADTPGQRSDAAFYQRIGRQADGSFSDVLSGSRPGVVTSVRLHGAIAALLAGWPAIHLSYERKGWGAYQDLGIRDYVHDARSFDPDLVLAQMHQLAEDPSPFWDRIRTAADGLMEQYKALVADLRLRLTGAQ